MSAAHLLAEYLRPANTNTFALPADESVQLAHAVYDPSKESLLLESEKHRSIYPEAFIINPQLGTLADLCTRTLAKSNGASTTTALMKNAHQQRLQYDAIDIEKPLEEIYKIDDMKFWQRVALAKTKDPGLKFRPKDFNWKNEGVALKYVEMVESCQAEFWPEQKMNELAEKIKDFVTDIHLRQLQSLQDYSFERYMVRDSDTDKATSTDVSYTTDEEQFNKSASLASDDLIGEEEQAGSKDDGDKKRASMFQTPNSSSASSSLSKLDDNDEEEVARLAERDRKRMETRRAQRRARREAQILRREKREAKLLAREEEKNKPKPKRVKVRNVFDLPVEEPADEEDKKLDKRNLEKFLTHKKLYKYPPEHCHHIDLRFLRHFENLVSFAIEFHPPELKDKFHTRHFNFSYDDIQHLASGIADLMQLRTFRLRDSRMDTTKLEMLVPVLNKLNVEVIDFGNDQLTDDAEDAFYELFQNTITIKSLELEGNKLGVNTLRRLGKALKKYGGILKYLGLARNPIDTESLHCLCSVIYKTPQIEELCLAGVRLSEMGILCCVSDELLRRHTVLRSLDMTAVPLSSRSGEMMVSAMRTNYNVNYLDVRGCNLDKRTETDLALCIKRNHYMAKNPYIGDRTKTASDVEDFIRENRHPSILAALEEIEKCKVCFESRPDIAERFSLSTEDSKKSFSYEIEDRSSKQGANSSATTELSGEETEILKWKTPFDYKPNEFNKEQFYEHVQLPGPGNRYYYFHAKTYTD